MKQKRAFFGTLAVAALATTAVSTRAGSATFDFGTDPASTPGIAISGNNDTPWQASGGNPGGFLALTYSQNSQDAQIVFPDIDAGKLVKAFKFEADLRIGNAQGNAGRPADGFSVSFARGNDPVLVDPATLGYGNFAGGAPENGTQTGIAVNFDTWAGNALPDAADLEGIIVRVDNVTVNRTPLATRNGLCDDNTSLQTGPYDQAYWDGGGDPRSPESWAGLCWKPFSIDLDETAKLTVIWKGRTILDKFQTTYFPSVSRLILAGRTGGANESTHFDNVRITTVLADGPIVGLPSGTACGFTIPIADAGTIIPVQSTIVMKVDGATVTPSISKVADVTTLTFNQPAGTGYAAGSVHPIEITFTDSNGKASVQARSFTVPAYTTIPATSATTSFTASSSGFTVRVHQLEFGRGPGDANFTVNAEQQLVAGGGYLAADGTVATDVAIPSGNANGLYEVTLVNWEQNQGAAGNFSISATDPAMAIPDEAIPGIPGSTSSTDNVAAEILTYLELPQGCHVLGVNSDDGFTVRLGHTPFGPLLGEFNGGRGAADTTFRIFVPTAGVYPIRLSWWEGGGGANVEFFSVDATGRRHLVNDRTDPAAIKAYSAGRTSANLASFNPYPGYLGADTRPTIAAVFRNDLTSVDNASIRLLVDGQAVTAAPTVSGNNVTVSYRPATAFAFNSAHTAQVIYSVGGTLTTNNFTFTVRGLGIQDLGSGFAIEAEHFDFDNGKAVAAVNTMPYEGGEYDGLSAVNNVDYAQGGNELSNAGYRLDEDPNVPMDAQTAADLDTQRPGFVVTTNYKIGWSGGDWYNYTRNIPAGKYKLVGAGSHGDPAGTADRQVARFGVVTAGKGTATQTAVEIGRYSTPSSGGWGNNVLSVAQLGGRDAVYNMPAGERTYRVWIDNGDYDWFAFVPTTDPASPVTATVTPTGGISVLPLTATITDLFRSGTLTASSVKLMVNGADVTSSATVTPSSAGATIRYNPTGGPVNYTLTYSDSSGASYTNSGSFTSVFNANNFIIEAEDFNHGGGQTMPAASTMPLTAGLYNGLAAVHDTDYHLTGNTPDSNLYRLGEDPNSPMDSPGGGLDRGSFTLSQNYKLGWVDSTEWWNYTRTFPNQTYNVYAAISHGDAGPTGGSLQTIAGTTTNELGVFNWPGGTGGWGANRLVPLTDAGGNLVAVPLNGAATIRYTAVAGDYDYLVFTPGTAQAVAQDITSPTDVVTGFGGTWPGGESPTNVFNNTSLKYLNFGKDPTSAPFEGPVGVVVTPARGATTVSGIRFYTANDASERDPADYVLEGSNDGTTFTQISAGPLSLPTTRTPANQNMLNGPRQEVTFANSAAYTTYRISFNNVRNNTTAVAMQIGEIELLGTGGVVVDGPRLAITRSGANITITWTAGTLQSSTTVNTGYAPVAGATGGTHTMAITGQKMFFRAVQ